MFSDYKMNNNVFVSNKTENGTNYDYSWGHASKVNQDFSNGIDLRYKALENEVREFVNKYGYGVKSDRGDYSVMITCSDIYKLKMILDKI